MALTKAKLKVLVRNIGEQVENGGEEAAEMFGAPLQKLRDQLGEVTVGELVEASVESVELGVDEDDLVSEFADALRIKLEAREEERKKAEAEKKAAEAKAAKK